MASAKGLSPEQNERVRSLLRDVLRRYDGNQSLLAPKLGVTQPTLSGFLSGRSGSSYLFATKLAELLKVDIHELLGGKRATKLPTTIIGRRELAAEIARDDGVDEAAILAVLAEPDAERSIFGWAARMKRRELEQLTAPDRAAAPRHHDAEVPDESGTVKKRKRA